MKLPLPPVCMPGCPIPPLGVQSEAAGVDESFAEKNLRA